MTSGEKQPTTHSDQQNVTESKKNKDMCSSLIFGSIREFQAANLAKRLKYKYTLLSRQMQRLLEPNQHMHGTGMHGTGMHALEHTLTHTHTPTLRHEPDLPPC